MLTPNELREIGERCEKATPEPWVLEDWVIVTPDDLEVEELDDFPNGQWLDNRRFLAASRQDIPALLAHIREQATEIDRLTRELAEARATLQRLSEVSSLEAEWGHGATKLYTSADVWVVRRRKGDTHDEYPTLVAALSGPAKGGRK
jgi:hypothetical protein